jgi:type III pantothenate kinase
MKNACIDFGNTRIKIGLFENQKLIAVDRFSNLEEVVTYLIQKKADHAIVSSVTLDQDAIKTALQFLKSLVFLNHQTPLPIRNDYATPETLGYDRLAAAIGAQVHFPEENCLVLDLGTAIKYDLILADGIFKGGIISPGKRMRFNALHTFTKKLPLLDSDEYPELVGDSTESCMQSGVINGLIAEINGIIEEYLKIYKLTLIICGGDAPFFESKIKYPTFAAPNLVLEGLNRILIYNVENS